MTPSSFPSIIAVNDHALHAIEAANEGGAVAIFWPFVSGLETREVMKKTFLEAMDVQATQLSRLVLEAETNLGNLDRLELVLGTLHEMVAREDKSISSEREELLAQLWTKLGGNRRELRGKDQHLKLLKALGEYRKRALVHVVGALQTLQSMSSDMEELRAKVAAPEIVGERIPVEVHMKSIRAGLERLSEGQTRARITEKEAMRRALQLDDER